MSMLLSVCRYAKLLSSIVMVAVFIIGCPQLLPPKTVGEVDIERFSGLWYQIARYYNPAEGDLAGVTAQYTLNDDGTVQVLNRGFIGDLDGTFVAIEGVARVVDADTNAKLAVTFTDPPVQGEFDFWIIELAEDYSYAVVSNSTRSTLYILSRTPAMEESLYQDLIAQLGRRGFDPGSIVRTPQFEVTPSPETVNGVDVGRFTGLWYEISRYFNPAEGNLSAVTAEYSLNEDGTVKVVNRGLLGDLEGTPVSIEGFARIVDPVTNAKLAVTFTNPPVDAEFEFWIVELGKYYAYAVISNSTRSRLYIISRTPTMEKSTYEGLLYKLTLRGFDPEEIVLTPQFAEMPPPETVESVDLERYAGLWYEIARYDTPFDEDAVGVTAEYTRNTDSTVQVLNEGLVGGLDGTPTSIEGVARVVDTATNAKLAVTFDRPDIAGIEFDYWVIELDEDYEWAVVTNATRFVLYILSRTPALDDAVYEDILYRIVKKGFEADKVQLTPQPEN